MWKNHIALEYIYFSFFIILYKKIYSFYIGENEMRNEIIVKRYRKKEDHIKNKKLKQRKEKLRSKLSQQ